ncbi:MAG: hypothetical protein JNK95_12625 [Candidatus Competibacter sp.]|nr:hypothetical protein [Candidatus Competibacter sp.]MDG4606861.1 hypothetical protein [Candidatus Contendobacter sp.]HRD48450.1 hypothetical protein [Candidatus Contendobacter sp.]
MRTPLLIGCTLVLAATGCNDLPAKLDLYEKPFAAIAIGDNRDRLIKMMGLPSSINSLAIPMVQLEELIWKSPANLRIYSVFIAQDRVAMKRVIQ